MAVDAQWFSARRAGRARRLLPKPKSEAWLLCAVANAYQHCQKLEALPAMMTRRIRPDGSYPNGAGRRCIHRGAVELAGRVGFDHQAVAADMPSFQQFKASLAAAIDEVRRPRRA